jgi:hypothetical protein
MDRLLQYYKEIFFSDLIATIVALVGIIIYVNKRPERSLKPFIFYLAAYCILTSTIWLGFLLPTKSQRNVSIDIITYADFLFTLLEFHIFYNYLKTQSPKKTYDILRFVFIGIALTIFIYSHVQEGILTRTCLYIVFATQAVFILAISIIQIVTLFAYATVLKIIDEPVFWITAGFLFFTLCTLPNSFFLVFEIKLKTLNSLFSVFHVFYIMLFALIIKAFLCKPAPITS